MGKMVTIIKLDADEKEVWRYTAEIKEVTANSMLVEGLFNRDDFLFNGMRLKRNDRFVETYYNDRWYNIFEIYDRDDGQLKGWYCNVTKPAVFSDGQIAYVDLALDLLVFTDGRQLVLDEDEFKDLNLPETIQEKAWAGLAALQKIFEDRFARN